MTNRDYLWKANEEGERAAKALTYGLNWGGSAFIEAFAKTLTNEHRTLQQDAFRAFVACLEKWAEARKEGYFDARNEATVTLSAHILDIVPDLKHLPRI